MDRKIVSVLRAQIHMVGDHIRTLIDFFWGYHFHAQLFRLFFFHRNVRGNYMHSQSHGHFCHRFSNLSEAKDSKGLIRDPCRNVGYTVLPNMIFFDIIGVLFQILVQRQHQGNGMLRHIPGAVFSYRADSDTPFCRLRQVYGIISGRIDGNDLQIRRMLQSLLIHFDKSSQKRIHILHFFEKLSPFFIGILIYFNLRVRQSFFEHFNLILVCRHHGCLIITYQNLHIPSFLFSYALLTGNVMQ